MSLTYMIYPRTESDSDPGFWLREEFVKRALLCDCQAPDVEIVWQGSQQPFVEKGSIKVYILNEMPQSIPCDTIINQADLVVYTDPSLLQHKAIMIVGKPLLFCPSFTPLQKYPDQMPAEKLKGLYYRGNGLNGAEYCERMCLLAQLQAMGFQFDILLNPAAYHHQEYIDALVQHQMSLVVFSQYQTVSGRLYENAAAYCLNVIYTPTPYLRECLYKLGWIHGFNCFCFRNLNELQDVYTVIAVAGPTVLANAHQVVEQFCLETATDAIIDACEKIASDQRLTAQIFGTIESNDALNYIRGDLSEENT